MKCFILNKGKKKMKHNWEQQNLENYPHLKPLNANQTREFFALPESATFFTYPQLNKT